MKTIILIIFMFLTCFAKAPFGLAWNSSIQDIKSNGIELTAQEVDIPGFKVYLTTSLPKNHSDADHYVLMFYKDTLVKILMISKTVSDDPFGLKGIEKYKEYTQLMLSVGYTEHRTFENIGRLLYKEPYEFYNCLNYPGCGEYISFFESGEGEKSSVKIKPEGRSSGLILITFEGPDCENAFKRVKEEQDKINESSF